LDFINSCYDLNEFIFQGHILTVAGVTVAICASPFMAASNMVALALWPTWVAVAITETIRKVHKDSLIEILLQPLFFYSLLYEKTHFKM
jgi:hypothetical protein